MWSKSESLKVKSSKEQIWKTWVDVENWKAWDDQVIDSKLNGPFQLAQSGVLSPKGGPSSNFELVEVSQGKSFTSRSKLPFTKMDFIHSIQETKDAVILTHTIEMKGPLSFLFSKIIGNKLIKEMPAALEKLDSIAQSKKS